MIVKKQQQMNNNYVIIIVVNDKNIKVNIKKNIQEAKLYRI